MITYDVEAGAAEVEQFGYDYERALRRYDEAEDDARVSGRNLDIVLVGAESLDVIKRTHSSYFETVELASLLAEGNFVNS